MLLAAIYAQRGETAKAAFARAEVLKKQPGMTIANFWWARASDVPAYRQQLEEHLNAGTAQGRHSREVAKCLA